MREQWAEYLTLLARDKAWGGELELQAAASTFASRIAVLAPMQTTVYNEAGLKRGTLFLWYEASHYSRCSGCLLYTSDVADEEDSLAPVGHGLG